MMLREKFLPAPGVPADAERAVKIPPRAAPREALTGIIPLARFYLLKYSFRYAEFDSGMGEKHVEPKRN
jgi:hypothetical protein